MFVFSFFSYPSEDKIYLSYNERCAWELLKSTQLQSTVSSIQEKCIRHNNSFIQIVPEAKKPLTPARLDSGPSRLERFDQYLSFVYGSHKVPESEAESASSPFVTKTASKHLQIGSSKQFNSTIGHEQSTKKVTFNTAE